MPADDVIAHRLRAIEAMSVDELEVLLAALPHVAAATAGKPSRRKLAAALADFTQLSTTLRMLSPQGLQLVSVAVAYGGSMTAEQVAAETGSLDTVRVTELTTELAERLLVDPSRGVMTLCPGIVGMLTLPGISLRREAEENRLSSSELQSYLQRHGVHGPPSKAGRLQTVLAQLTDRAALSQVVDSLSAGARTMLDQLVGVGAAGCSTLDLGVSPYLLGGFRAHRSIPRLPALDALDELSSYGLVDFDEYRSRVAVWQEVLRTMTGSVFRTWPRAWAGALVVVDRDGVVRPPMAPSAIAALMREMASSPLQGLKAGGIGVKVVREVAKKVGHTEPVIGLMIKIGQLLGLVDEHAQLVGRGRAATWNYQYALAAPAAEAFTKLDTASQWQRMVEVWLDDFGRMGGWVMGAIIRQFLADLIALPDDRGVGADELADWASLRHTAFADVDLDKIVLEMRALDLLEPIGPIALTPLARVLLTEPDRVASMMPSVETSFVVQADHSVIAPPTLDPAIRSRLEAIAVVTSDSSVRVYRLDPSKIAAALAGSDTADGIIEFLATHSSLELPAPVGQLVHDVERQRGGLAVSAATTVVTAVDVVALATAVKVKASGLRLIAPTVAVSMLPPSKVVAALRAKGLAPTMERGEITLGNANEIHRRPMPAAPKAKRSTPLVIGPAQLAELAKSVG